MMPTGETQGKHLMVKCVPENLLLGYIRYSLFLFTDSRELTMKLQP